MSALNKHILDDIVKRIFSNWTALKMAVEHGMGTKDQVIGFCEDVIEIMTMNESLDQSELADELEERMDDHFNIQLEDESQLQVAEEIIKFFKYYIAKDEINLKQNLEKLPPVQQWILGEEPRSKVIKNKDVEEGESREMTMEVDSEAVNSQSVKTVDADGWTIVNNKKR